MPGAMFSVVVFPLSIAASHSADGLSAFMGRSNVQNIMPGEEKERGFLLLAD